MNAVIVNCFDTYENRVELIYRFLKQKCKNVKVITSDFRHSEKVFRDTEREDFVFLNTKPYYKNMSVARMYSHWNFARKAARELEKSAPRLIYVLAPPNSLVKETIKYKKRHAGVKVIVDLIDLWPETMPIRRFKDSFLFGLWADIRDKYLDTADYVITECDLYQNVLKNYLDKDKTKTIYLARKNAEVNIQETADDNKVSLCYLGSINNIIDIEVIGRIIKAIDKAVDLHIIGAGEQKEELLRIAKESGAVVYDHGRVYDACAKQEIFNMCDYGLNIMKPYVCVGLTMKSIDYFEAGLPIINNIKGDTWEFVEQYGIGVNYLDDQCLKLFNVEKQHVREFFEKNFTEEVFFAHMECVYDAMFRK